MGIMKETEIPYTIGGRWAGYAARMGARGAAYRVLAGKPEGEEDHLKKPGADGRIILK